MSSAESCVVFRKGPIFVGWLSLETDVFYAVCLGVLLSGEAWWLLWVSLAIQILHLVLSILLLVGISNKNVAFIKAFLVVNTSLLVYCCGISLTYFVMAFTSSYEAGINIIIGVASLFQVFLAMYYTIVIHFYAISLGDGPMQQGLLPYQQGHPGQHVFQPYQQDIPVWQPYKHMKAGQPEKHGKTPTQLGQPVLHI